jgi:hypothetical protein
MTYGPCDLCKGSGRIRGTDTCPVCDGFGIWGFVAEDNEAAVKFLNDPTVEVSEHAKFICGERIHSLPPDQCENMLVILDRPVEDLNALHLAGAEKWGWAWVHANRFAIALCRLNGGDPTNHVYGLTKMAWFWLEREKQVKIEVPWIVENNSKKDDVAIDMEA